MDDPHRTGLGSQPVIDDLRNFFRTALRGTTPDIDDDYFEAGHVNSLFALELVTFVEQHFSISVEVDDLELDNFRTIRRTAEFVCAKRAVSTGPGPVDG